jgi:hypothetical protein
MTSKLPDGTLVLHPRQPTWGPGKVVHTRGNLTHVVFRDRPGREALAIRTDVIPLELAPVQQDDILDNLPPVKQVGDKFLLPAERLTVQQAIDAFRDRFPGGFRDKEYIGTPKRGERMYKLLAHQHYVEDLGGDTFRELLDGDLPELTRRAMRCVGRVNLLYPVEQAALRDALEDRSAARRLFETLAAVVDATEVSEATFEPYLKAVVDLPAKQARVASWPVATILPFLARPRDHLFLKPSITVNAAERMGFNLNYKAEPNWLTYWSAIRMATVYRQRLASLGPEDLIDVQSFFYVTCGGYDI